MEALLQARSQTMKKYWLKALPKLVGTALNVMGLLAPKKTVELSMKVFAKPRKGRVLSHQRKFLQKAKAETLEVNSQQFHIHIFGNSGYPVLLAHGWESNSWRWRKLMRHLGNDHFQFIAIDAPGHGMTPSEYFNVHGYAEAIAAAAKKYQCQTIVGHSIGGFACLFAAAHFDDGGIQKVISLAAPSSLRLIMEKYFSIISLSGHMQNTTFALFPKLYGLSIDDLDIQTFGHKIGAAGLVVHDLHDNINGPESAYLIHQCWPSSELIITQDSDHSLQHEIVFDAVKKFFTKE